MSLGRNRTVINVTRELHARIRDIAAKKKMNATKWVDEVLTTAVEKEEANSFCPHGHSDWDNCPVCGH